MCIRKLPAVPCREKKQSRTLMEPFWVMRKSSPETYKAGNACHLGDRIKRCKQMLLGMLVQIWNSVL